MNTHQSRAASSKKWQGTQYSNIVRQCASGIYYARLRIKGKLIWRSLQTDRISIAQAKLPDVEREEHKKAEAGHVKSTDKIFISDCIKAYRENGFRPAVPKSKKDVRQLKPAAKAYYEQRITALMKSWQGLETLEVRRVSDRQCKTWADQARAEMGATTFNHTLGMLRNIFEYGIKAGARYNNPASSLMRESETGKNLVLPNNETFQRFVTAIEEGGGGRSKHCADLVRFMAFGGLRKNEAAYVKGSDCDFERGLIHLRGHPETGLKNRRPSETRTVPMIPEMRELLGRLQQERGEEWADQYIMKVRECQKAMDRAAKEVEMARITHHDLRHLFATRCIESGVDIPTVSRWLGHKDGGALAMKIYGHLRDQHSLEMAGKVKFSMEMGPRQA